MRFLDSGIAFDVPLIGRKGAWVEIGSTLEIRVPKGRRLGVAVFSSRRGFDEAVIEPVVPASGGAGPSGEIIYDVTMDLPRQRPLGEFEYQPMGNEGQARPRRHARTTLRLPLTGIVIAESGNGFGEEPDLHALVPPGEYRLQVEPFFFRMCGESPIRCPDVAGWEELVTVQPPAKTRVHRSFVSGAQLRARFDLRGATPEQTASLERDRNYLATGWWQAGAKRSDPGRLLVSVTLAKWDEAAHSYARPRIVNWISTDRRSEAGVAPLAVHVHSSARWAPGKYLVEVAGPMVKPATFQWEVGQNRQGQVAEAWELESVER